MAQTIQHHLTTCPAKKTGLPNDCSCKKEIIHYFHLAVWTSGIFLFEFFGGYFSGSQALYSDSFHLLMDLGENLISSLVLILVLLGGNEKKLRVWGGNISGLLLLYAGYIIVTEGYDHLIHPHKVEWYMGIFAAITLYVVEKQLKHHHEAPAIFRNITHWWQWIHLIFDKWALRFVIGGSILMLVFDNAYWIDGALSVGIGAFIIVFILAKLSGIELHPGHEKSEEVVKTPHNHKPGEKCDGYH